MVHDVELLKLLNADRALAMAMFFDHRHKDETPPFHLDVITALRAADQYVLIEAFRGAAKSSLTEEFSLLEAAFGNYKYHLIFGETYTKACQRLEAIKHEIMTNHRLRGVFGDLRNKSSTWTENKIVLSNGVCIETHGWEEEIRGYKHLDMRPDRVTLDDIENKSSVRDTSTVEANWRKLYLQLIPAMDVKGKLRMLGTPLADDCMVTRARASKHWVAFRFPICDDSETTSTWPARYPIEWIKQQKETYSEGGMLREFNQEYMLIAAGSQGKPFTEDMIREQDMPPATYAPRVKIIDPARTVDVRKSDQTGLVVVSAIGSRIYVHESGGHYWQPDQVIDEVFKADDTQVYIERNSLDDWLMQPIRARMLTTGRAVDVQAVLAPHEMDKAQFIMGLRPFFVAGDIILVGGRAKHQQLVAQILNFPSGKRDVLNALAYALRVFSGVPVYGDFSDANIGEPYLNRGEPLLLALNANNSETTAVLCSTDGRNLNVLMDWTSPLPATDCIPDMARLVKAAFPGHRVQAWAPADVMDQTGRSALLAGAKAAGLQLQAGHYTAAARGSLSPLLRTSSNGRRMLLVNPGARNTLYALARGYHWPVRSGGERSPEPARNQSRTLLEGLEALTAAMNAVDNGALGLHCNATNTLGTRYISALPRQ